MKKILLSLLSLVALAVNAQTEFTWISQNWGCIVTEGDDGKITWTAPDPIEFSKNGLTMSSTKGEAATAPTVAANVTPNDARIYAKGVLKVAYTENITGLEFKISTAGKKRLAEITASTGEVTISVSNGIVYWVGNAKDVEFTVGEKAKYGTDGETKAGQFDFESVKLYTGGATPDVPSSDLLPSGLAYSQGSKTITLGTEYELPTLSNPNNLPVTFRSSKEEVATVDASGNVTIVAAGTCTITAESEATDTYLAGKASYSLTVKEAQGGGDTPGANVTIAETYSLEKNAVVTLGAFEVVYVNGAYIYIKDETGDGLLYAANFGLNAGDKVAAGLAGKMDIYYNLYEIKPTSQLSDLSVTSGTPAEPKTATEAPSTETMNQYVVYKGVEFAEGGEFVEGTASNLNGTWNGNTIIFRSNFKNAQKFEAGKKYDVVGANAVYKNDIQVYFISATESGAAAINSVAIDSENAPAYNLAGQRVAAGFKGAVIKNGKKYIQK